MFPGPVCISLTPTRIPDVFSADLTGADCVEVRLDYLEDVGESLQARWDRLPLPVIATCRGIAQGGRFRGTAGDEIRVLEAAVRNGAQWVDLDYRWAREIEGAEVIASCHDFAGTPPDLERLTEDVCARPGTIAKIAVMTHAWADVARVLKLVERTWPKPLIGVGMGATGQMTRVVGPSRGSQLTYVASASSSSGTESAPGQIAVSELLDTYRFRSVRSSTRLIGIVGNPVGHSTSPELHNRAIGEAGLDYVYLKFPVRSLEDFFASAPGIGIVGFSVTLPHKVEILRFLDRLSPEAQAVGAVNTVSRTNGEWVGDNTDVHGVRESLKNLDLSRMRVVVLGTGGAARAAVAALRDARSVTLLSRSMPRGVVDWNRKVDVDRLDRYGAHDAELLINATPVGMSPDVDAAPLTGRIRADVVFDMVYNPDRTRLLREAEAQGKQTISGRTMLLAQAARQFEIWTGCAPSPQVFAGAAR